ncbi:isochorismatase family protein [Microbacterium sp. JB110]|uniref:isochorismatase family protein n=1 Tax=Microbacterium sp. JB110 TaxID=2024477 RepID=UPI00097F2DFD|nr:isochorismatase family protein [Microbacterium sp. JB110]RCS61792.1 isochorismatase family protein [Microbacterium sp. JB110]SJM65908.1 Nicotinamidase [Frigoribacterium sp. JB110]
MSRGLLIVDVQNDFTEGGALAVTGGDAVARGVSRFLAERAGEYAAVIASRDWHDGANDNGGHFAEGEPDFVDTWPVHCVAGTEGADYDPLFDASAVTHHVKKGQGEPAYSAFEGTTEAGSTLSALLTDLGVVEIDVVGIATDHCVRASVLDAIRDGRAVRVFTDLVAGVAPDSSDAALAEIRAAGGALSASGTV